MGEELERHRGDRRGATSGVVRSPSARPGATVVDLDAPPDDGPDDPSGDEVSLPPDDAAPRRVPLTPMWIFERLRVYSSPFVPVELAPPDRRKADILVLVVGASVLGLLTLGWALPPNTAWWAYVVLAIGALLNAAAVGILRWTGSVAAAANTLCFAIFGGVFTITLLLDGTPSPSAFAFALIPSTALLVGRPEHARWWLALVIVTLLGLTPAYALPLSIPELGPPGADGAGSFHAITEFGDMARITYTVVEIVVTALLWFVADLTEGLRSGDEGQLERANGKLATANLKLHEARRAADAANKAKSLFLANMSHEIRTPLNGVLGFGQILQRSDLGAVQRTYVDHIVSQASNLDAILKDILDVARIEAGRLHMERIPMEVSAVVWSVIELMDFSVRERGLQLSFVDGDHGRTRVLGDPTRLRQIIWNLLSNAQKFTKRGGIAVRLFVTPFSETHVTVQVDVADTGIGIAPDQVARLFNSFTQADESTARNFGGTGLGLAICRDLVRLMNGTISVASEPGVGSTFTIRVDLERAPDDASASRAPVPVDRVVQRHLLLVEDSVVNQLVVVPMLEALGAHVRVASSGPEAIEWVRRERFDAILMDCQMPGMDGYETTRRLRELPSCREVPIVALTASVFPEDVQRCFGAGMNAHIGKPVLIEHLARVLNEVAPGEGQSRE
ncbi:MAG TPA: ATP-binding protein [Myxococcota bacterium]|nr:ATP-binding protein [Myxococcota bacterium]